MIRNIIFFAFSTFVTLNIKKIDKNNRIFLSLRLQSVSEVRDKSMEEKYPISHDQSSASSGDVKKVIHLYNRGKEAIEYPNLQPPQPEEVGDKHGEGGAYGNLGNTYGRLGDFKKAIEYLNLHLKIAKEVGDKHAEGKAYGNLGNAYHRLGDFKKAIEYHNLHLKIAKEVEDKHGRVVLMAILAMLMAVWVISKKP